MFEIESKKPDEITVTTKKTSVTINVAQSEVDGNLAVGKIQGPGEFEIGDIYVRGIDVIEAQTSAERSNAEEGKEVKETVIASDGVIMERPVIYLVMVGGVKIAVIGGCEKALDELGMIDILCASSVRAVREIEPKLVVSMGNIDGMVTELKLAARTEKKLKVKNADSLPVALEVVALS